MACAKEQGVDFCYECKDFPCQKLQPLAEGAERYPHNLKFLRPFTRPSRTEASRRRLPRSATSASAYFRQEPTESGTGPQLAQTK